MTAERSVVIVGGGLVGSLTACYFAKRGWKVDLFEKRPGKCRYYGAPVITDDRHISMHTISNENQSQHMWYQPYNVDIRLPENAHLVEHRSINLAISERGFSALRRLNPGLERQVKALVVPMHGRMIHSLDGKQTSQAYDVFGRHINSVGRSTLIKILLDTVSSYSLVTLHFNHEFLEADLDSGHVTFINDKGERQEMIADLIVGADGAYSKVRQRMMAKVNMNYSQKYIEHGYCEFSMPALNGDYAIDPNHLHIWPRGSFMLIALPNMDKTFTCTLFMPWSQFEQ
ncbi:kynurenine 3-monooxygenase, mitochondrial precursor, partial [Coemansia sp. RSA 2603]